MTSNGLHIQQLTLNPRTTLHEPNAPKPEPTSHAGAALFSSLLGLVDGGGGRESCRFRGHPAGRGRPGWPVGLEIGELSVRILFTSFPAFGHLHPMMPLALAARDAGHEVRVATGSNLADWVRRCGLPVTSIGLSEDELAEVADRDHPGADRTLRMFTDVWVGRAIGDLLDASSRWTPDLVIHEEEEYAGPLLACLLGIPCVTQSWAAPARPAAGRAAAVNALTPLWDRYAPGRAPRRVGDLYLDACPPALQSADLGDIARSTPVFAVRPSLFDGPPSPPPAFLTDLPRPAVYVTLGTVAVFSEPGLLSRISTALSARFASVLVTTGPNPVSALYRSPRERQPGLLHAAVAPPPNRRSAGIPRRSGRNLRSVDACPAAPRPTRPRSEPDHHRRSDTPARARHPLGRRPPQRHRHRRAAQNGSSPTLTSTHGSAPCRLSS